MRTKKKYIFNGVRKGDEAHKKHYEFLARKLKKEGGLISEIIRLQALEVSHRIDYDLARDVWRLHLADWVLLRLSVYKRIAGIKGSLSPVTR